MGKFERAEAALAAARAIQSPGIIKVSPGSTVKREQPKGDASVREATDSLRDRRRQASPGSRRAAAQRRAEAEAAQAKDAAERLDAVKRANSEDNTARARVVAAERERNAKKYQNASTFYGGSGCQGAGADFFGSKGGSFSDQLGSRGAPFPTR